jgi:DNA repair exonuclease SbcCD nuclease subunit
MNSLPPLQVLAMARNHFQFVHAADLHVDSPLRGLEYLEDAPVDRLRSATRAAMQNLVETCIQESVAFLIVAGDVFDGPWMDMRTGLWTARQFRRLEAANIKVYLLRGNHDAASEVRQALVWPANVSEFPVDAPGSFFDEGLAVALHGQGFAQPAITDDLAARYPKAAAGYFNIGVLHTSLTGDANHDTYAATSPEVLSARGYDYWALGHVHAQRIVSEHPWVVYAGNTQGRHVRECGAKGCLLVTVTDRSVQNVRFVPTDVVRWQQAIVNLSADMNLPQLHEQVIERLSAIQAEAAGRLLAIRIIVRGACEAHWQIVDAGRRQEAAAQLRDAAAKWSDVWIENVVFETSAPVNVQQLRQGFDLLGDLLRAVDHALVDDTALQQLAAKLQPLHEKAALELHQVGVDLNDQVHLRRWLRQTESLLIGLLAQPGHVE